MSTDAKEQDGFLVGVISDTHGHLRPEVAEAFADVDLIIHAGDIGSHEVLDALRAIAPVHAVRGNMDGGWAHG
ncbi:MAG: metallophosphatase family protein, partial [Deltaproteobacteria bacterium]|nr:metallophosphatase family protein [Deltaproteobacteria bacterium]